MKYRKLKPWKYQLTEPFTITLGFVPAEKVLTEFIKIDRETLTLSKYYAWDGASGPCPDTPNVMKGSLVHDALYQLMRLGLLDRSYRKFADLELKRICLQSGMNKFWAGIIYWGCRVFCDRATWPKPQTPVYQIP
jgi:hypothetical protein